MSYKGEKLNCITCKREYVRKLKNGSTLKRCASCVTVDRRRGLKEKAVRYKGGKCERCGYSKCMRALVFHHVDPKEKEFEIGSNFDRKWTEVENEINKCILVCTNCHAEIHEECPQSIVSDALAL